MAAPAAPGPSLTERLARACAQRPWRTIAAWLVAIVLAVVAIGAFLGDSLSTEARVTNDPESELAYDLIHQSFPERAKNMTTELIVVRSDEFTVDDPEFQAKLDELLELGRGTGSIAAAGNPLEDDGLVSPDRHAVLIPLRLEGDPDDTVGEVIEAVEGENGKGGFLVAMTGSATTDHDINEVSERDLQNGELRIGLPAALLVLVLVFGALVSSVLPLVLAIVSIVVALGLTALVAQGFELSIFVVNMLTGMGLALGIDYSLFVVSRFREERVAGAERTDAVGRAGATASRAVLFSGTAFVLAMVGLLLVQSTIMRSLAVGAILVGIVSVIAAVTLLPAILGLLGDRIDRLQVPYVGRRLARDAGAESRFWSAVVDRVVRRPVVSLIAAAALLVVLAVPVLGINIGAAGISTLPDSLTSKQGYLALQESFPGAGADPAEIVVAGDVQTAETQAAIRRLEERLRSDHRFGPPTVDTNETGNLAVVTVPVSADALSDEAVDAVRDLRAEYVPAAFQGDDAQVLVTGRTAENIDYFDVMEFWLPWVLLFVLGLTFVLLTIAFRSVVIAGTAIGLNLLSVGAAYGLLVAVFQYGWGADLLGLQQVDTVEAWVPLFLFAVLFGLSMDYQVFLLSRIRERYTRTGDTTDAVRFGIGSTARIITGAALIIVAVFAGFAAGDLVMFQQMGFGVAIALLIDATIVRSVLVPAAMTLAGERNWYLPSWLEWLPHVEIEGEAAPKGHAAPLSG
jgi:putative drug exporter of the RND superfamily